MAKITFVLNDNLDLKMREFIDKNNMGITTFITVAIQAYLDQVDLKNEMTNMFKVLMEKAVKNELSK